jgi:hypothetical protein
MAKDRRSKDQKRKAKLAQRAKRQVHAEQSLAYEGSKYQSAKWVPHVHATESAIWQTIQLSDKKLTNAHVRAALTQLVHELRDGKPPLLPEGTPEMFFTPGKEVEFLVWNIRNFWGALFEREGSVATDDLIGILRTLLNSIDAHEWHTGPDLGYVAFLDDFLRGPGIADYGSGDDEDDF